MLINKCENIYAKYQLIKIIIENSEICIINNLLKEKITRFNFSKSSLMLKIAIGIDSLLNGNFGEFFKIYCEINEGDDK